MQEPASMDACVYIPSTQPHSMISANRKNNRNANQLQKNANEETPKTVANINMTISISDDILITCLLIAMRHLPPLHRLYTGSWVWCYISSCDGIRGVKGFSFSFFCTPRVSLMCNGRKLGTSQGGR